MAKTTFDHSEEWFEKLTRPINELSAAECEAIAAHTITCSVCYHMLADFALLDRLVQAIPAPDFPKGLPPRLLQSMQDEARAVKSAKGWANNNTNKPWQRERHVFNSGQGWDADFHSPETNTPQQRLSQTDNPWKRQGAKNNFTPGVGWSATQPSANTPQKLSQSDELPKDKPLDFEQLIRELKESVANQEVELFDERDD